MLKEHWVARFVMEEEAVGFYLVGNGICLCAQVMDLGIINTVSTTPLGVVCIQIPHDNSWEVGT
jgi:hypothetical protein